MLDKVKKYILKHRLINTGDIVITGVSGGPDSMALLHILKELDSQMGFRLIAAHLNHQLRAEADEEEDFVREYCRKWQVPFFSRKLDIKKLAAGEKKSLEETGRDCRYQFFNELIAELGADYIATAHHQDDVAETVLLHLLRGSGIKGLRGIMPVNGKIIRPLLCVSKKRINEYLETNCISYCTDRSNFDSAYTRNRIRHRLIPDLKADYNPRIVESLNQLADIAREENEALEKETDCLWEKIVLKKKEDSIILDRGVLLNLYPAYQRRVILKTLAELKGEPGWNMLDVNLIMELAGKEGSGKNIHLKKGIRVSISYGQLIFDTRPKKDIFFSYIVQVPGQININETGERYSFDIVPKAQYKPEPGDIYLDYDKLDQDLFLRSRRAGDIFNPVGLGGRKKIKDFFIDLKIPVTKRNNIPLLASEKQIYAVLGLRLSADVLVNAQTRRILVIKKEGEVKTN